MANSAWLGMQMSEARVKLGMDQSRDAIAFWVESCIFWRCPVWFRFAALIARPFAAPFVPSVTRRVLSAPGSEGLLGEVHPAVPVPGAPEAEFHRSAAGETQRSPCESP